MCGEIDDEDTSLVERAEQRADRFDGYSEKRAADADRARAGVEAISQHIPFGQPILVGHHSERRARKDAERIENGIRRAVAMWECSEYWERRAAGAISNAKYKERPDVRHRRIKKLEADKRKQDRHIAESEKALGMWRREGLTNAQAQNIANFDRVSFRYAPEDQFMTSLWSALDSGKIDAAKAAEIAIRAHERTIAWAARWSSHYANRLTYERAMLGEAGGIKADAFDIQPGGRVLIGAEWLAVLRVNRRDGQILSVTTTARYVPVRGIEEVKGYQAPEADAAEKVEAATKLAPLCNYPGEGFLEMTAAEWKRKPKDYKSVRTQAATAERGAYRYRQAFIPGGSYRVAQVFITDQKRTDPPSVKASPAPAQFEVVKELVTTSAPCQAAASRDDKAARKEGFQALREQLKAGVQVVSAPQLFPTPQKLAERMVKLAGIEQGHAVLEPSFGTQRILRAVRAYAPACHLTGVEISPSLVKGFVCADRVICGDFLAVEELGTFDRVVMNPPFAGAQDIEHIRHALSLLKPGGKLVAICAGGPRQHEQLRPLVEQHGGTWEPLPADTFAESGTH
nr:DUF3560 domain-containing protein [Pseudomonas sp. JG-B]